VRRFMHWTTVWARNVGLISKLKIGVSFAQIIAMLDSTYAIGLPESWFRYTEWLRFLGDLNWIEWVVPSPCIVGSGMTRSLLLRTLTPLFVIVSVPLLAAPGSILHHRFTSTSTAPKLVNAMDWALSSLPLSRKMSTKSNDLNTSRPKSEHVAPDVLTSLLLHTVVLSFCFTPSVSAAVFRAWYCVPFAHKDLEEHSYLAHDLSVRCDGSSEHQEVVSVAWVLVLVCLASFVSHLRLRLSDSLFPFVCSALASRHARLVHDAACAVTR
jgi:hypothetical protein